MGAHSYEYVQNYVKESMEELISEEYVNNYTSLQIKCFLCSQIYVITFGNYQQGRRHKNCKCKHLATPEYIEGKARRSRVKKTKKLLKYHA